MTDQLQLVDVPATPRLTERQQRALKLLEEAGYDGLASDELGAHFHRHTADERCEWCGSTGFELGQALRREGKAQQRRRRAPGGDVFMVWTVAGKLEEPAAPSAVAYGEFPEGF